uniref:Uncharacterized protein n=1 Tax=Arundo donax TaxID=35708 RepID=A0A0A9BGN9_ARUDO
MTCLCSCFSWPCICEILLSGFIDLFFCWKGMLLAHVQQCRYPALIGARILSISCIPGSLPVPCFFCSNPA